MEVQTRNPQMNFEIPTELKTEAEECAKLMYMKLSPFCREAIREKCERVRQEKLKTETASQVGA